VHKKIFFVSLFSGLMVGNVLAADPELVSQALDVYTSDYHMVSVRPVMVDAPAASLPEQVEPAPVAREPKPAATAPEERKLLGSSRLVKQHEFYFGVERYQYKYHEYDSLNGGKIMNLSGFYDGLLAAYTFRPKDIDSVTEAIANMFRAEFRYASGRVNYTGSTWGGDGLTFNGIHDYTYEVRGVVGKECPFWNSWMMTPYIGVGWRYLHNGSAVMAGGYGRESKYLYFPLGFDLGVGLGHGWSLGWNAEYDFLYFGQQTSHFEDVDSQLDPLGSRQNKGFGWRTSLKVVKELKHMSLSLEPYYRFWHIQDSEVGFLTSGGQIIQDNSGQPVAVLEPDNITQELGLRMGAQF
jgi:hypothetical protein